MYPLKNIFVSFNVPKGSKTKSKGSEGKTMLEEFNCSDDLDDDWFYESVMRYNTLQMFYLQNEPKHILQLDESTLCVVSSNEKCQNDELMELQLPVKLTMPAEDEGRSKENDFKMLSGMYINNKIVEINALRDERKIITSQENVSGLKMYNYQFNTRGEEKQEYSVLALTGWETPNFVINQEEKLIICSKCYHKPLFVYDMKSDKVAREMKCPLFAELSSGLQTNITPCSCNNLKCQLIDSNKLALLNSRNGLMGLIDLRTNKVFSKFGNEENKKSDELWTLSSYDFKTCSFYFGTISTRGILILYDVRNTNIPLRNECFNSEVNNYNLLKFKVADRDRFSISGLDSNIYVYNILSDCCELSFTHNGHCHNAFNKVDENVINDHIWLPNIGTNFLVSICKNKSLNCWEYNSSVG